MKVYLFIRDLWVQVAESIHEMCVVNTDATTYQSKSPNMCLETAEKAKKKKYLVNCFKQHRHFNPLVVSLEVIIGVEAEAKLNRIASRLTMKWKEPYSRTCGQIKSRIAITLIRAAHRCIQRGRVPVSHISVKIPQWEDGAGLHLFR